MNPPVVPLGTVLQAIEAGTSFKAFPRPAEAGEFGVLKLSAITWGTFESHENKALPPGLDLSDVPTVRAGDLLISRANTTELVGAVAIPEADYPNLILSDKTLRLVPIPSRSDARYLYYALRRPAAREHIEARATGTSGSMRNISQDSIRTIPIPLPPLPEQRRIAAILDEADALRRKRQEALGLLDDLLRSTFLEMFGDPVTNPRGWDKRSLCEVVAAIDPGWSANSLDHPAGQGEWGVLKVSAVSTGLFLEAENKAVESPTFAKPPITPRRGDLLFSRANTRELVAATCLVDEDAPLRFLPDKLWRLSCRPELACVEWLRFLLANEAYRASLAKHATGTSGSMLNVSQEKLLDMVAPLPPISLQREFGAIVWVALDQRRSNAVAVTTSEALFSSLLHRAFTGQL